MHRYSSLIKLKAKMTPNKTNSIFKGFWNESSYFRFQPSKSQDLSSFLSFFWDRGALEQVLRSSKRHMIWCRISWLSLLTSSLLDSYKIFWFVDKNRWELTCFCFAFCLFLTMHHALSVCSPFQHSSQILGWKSCIDVHSSPLRLFHFRVWKQDSKRWLHKMCLILDTRVWVKIFID